MQSKACSSISVFRVLRVTQSRQWFIGFSVSVDQMGHLPKISLHSFAPNSPHSILSSKYQVDRTTVRHVPVLSSSVQVVESARDLCAVIDVTAVRRAAYFHLRQQRLITRSLSVDAAKTLVQSFITCHLDYCNALFSGITDSLFRRLQSVQNAAARLVTGTRRRDHITTVLRQLHWLPVRQRVDFKLALLIYKALHDATIVYR